MARAVAAAQEAVPVPAVEWAAREPAAAPGAEWGVRAPVVAPALEAEWEIPATVREMGCSRRADADTTRTAPGDSKKGYCGQLSKSVPATGATLAE
jgi:hypothetical protein